jgi:SAM-dependent methyltransferase
MDPTSRFGDRAADYRRYRPDYPRGAIDAILRGLGDPTLLLAVDVGAGTGISSRALGDRGVRVVAIEPNAGMRAQAVPHEKVSWRDGTAEATGQDGESADLLLCAQAFHWFRAHEALTEFHRVLRPSGRLALMWNSRDRRDELTRGYIQAIHEVNGEHPAELRPFDPAVVATGGMFPFPRLEVFDHVQELDLPGLVGRATSASYVPKEGPAFERLAELLAGLFDRHRDASGRVTMRYVTQVFFAARR